MSTREEHRIARAAFREFVRTHHPDVGGDPEEFSAGIARMRSPPIDDEAPRRRAVDRYDGPVEFAQRPATLPKRLRCWWARRYRPRVH